MTDFFDSMGDNFMSMLKINSPQPMSAADFDQDYVLVCNNCGARDAKATGIIAGLETDYCTECKEPEDFRKLDQFQDREEQDDNEADERAERWQDGDQ